MNEAAERMLTASRRYWERAYETEEPTEVGAMYASIGALRPGDELPGGLVVVPKTLTYANGAKAALIGEFSFSNDYGEYTVPWTTIKEIHKAMVQHFAMLAAAKEEG